MSIDCKVVQGHMKRFSLSNTVNHEIFVVKIFSDRLISAKIKCTKIVRIINVNAVWGRLSENYFTRKFIAQNIFDMKYSQFTVLLKGKRILDRYFLVKQR